MSEELSDALKAKYPTAHHAPLADCKRCNGTGERWYESKSPYSRSGWKPCMCIFVAHEHVALVSEIFQEMIAREKARLCPIQIDHMLPNDTIKIGDRIITNIQEATTS